MVDCISVVNSSRILSYLTGSDSRLLSHATPLFCKRKSKERIRGGRDTQSRLRKTNMEKELVSEDSIDILYKSHSITTILLASDARNEETHQYPLSQYRCAKVVSRGVSTNEPTTLKIYQHTNLQYPNSSTILGTTCR